MTLIPGFDVSHYQSVGQVRQAIAAGAFVFVKATQGVLSSDNEHDADVALIRAGRRQVGHYHFAQDTAKAVLEARWFIERAAMRAGDLAALDLEQMNGSWPARAAYAVEWLTYVQKAIGARPFWYVNKSWEAALAADAPQLLARWPLWIADPGTAGASHVHLWVIQQYGTGGGMDHDVATRPLAPYAVPGAAPLHPLEDDMTLLVFVKDTDPDPKPAYADAGPAIRKVSQAELIGRDHAAGGPGKGHQYIVLPAADPFFARPTVP